MGSPGATGTAPRRFADRAEAGRTLAAALGPYGGRRDLLVLGLPRGGVPVAHEVAKALKAPLDVLVVRKLGVPGHDELAMGAIAGGGVRVLNPDVVSSLAIPAATLEEVVTREALEVARREQRYRGDRPPPDIAGRTVIVVDDGLATGATMRAAIQALRAQRPRELVVAVPVGAEETCRQLVGLADDVVCVLSPPRFDAVGRWFVDFSAPTDSEVRRLVADQATGGATMA